MNKDNIENPYRELKRVENSLENFRMSIRNNLEKLGYCGNPHRSLLEKACQINNQRGRIQIEKLQNKHLLHLFVNMWMNEQYLYTIEKIIGLDYIQFFFLEYICFYYSLFTGISIIERILNPDQKTSHRKKISNFNKHLQQHRILQDLYFPPFTFIVDSNGLDIDRKHLDCRNGIKTLDNWIKNYKSLRNQKKLQSDEYFLQTDIYSLRYCKSILKYFNENDDCKIASFLNYFLNMRHFFHYRVSSIFEGHHYGVQRMVNNNRRNMREILAISNFIPEVFYFIKVDSTNLTRQRDVFCGAILSNSKSDSSELKFLDRIEYLS
jgi:hypothetical protein